MTEQTRIIAETPDSVTLTRAAFDKLIALAEDRADQAASNHFHANRYKEMQGALTGDEIKRILSGTHPLTIWRERAGLSQRDLAAKSGIVQPQIAQIERSAANGSARTLAALAAALGVTVEDISS